MPLTSRVPLSEETACNLCGSRSYDVVGTKDRDGRPLRTTICRACGLVWTNPRPTLQDLERYYRHTYRTDYTRSAVPTRRKLLRGMLGALERRRWLQPMLRRGSRVLDVGCGAGELVYLLRAAGCDAAGIEPDETFAEHARAVLGVPVQTATVDTALVDPGTFDLATMFHALEHVADPRATLARLAAWLRPSGVAVIEVPNVEAVCQAPAHRFHYAHLFAFSPGTLEGIAARAGFARVRLELTDDGGNIVGVFRKRQGGSLVIDPAEGRARYERTREVLRRHTAVRHYLSLTPYTRALARGRRRLQENARLKRYPTVESILDWASRGGLEEP
jgi:SAM-dependent methyltransferase